MKHALWQIVKPILIESGTVPRFLSRFAEAQTDGMAWPDEVQDEALREWTQKRQKEFVKKDSVTPIKHGKSTVNKPTVVGIRTRSKDTGKERFEQLHIAFRPWPEVFAWGAMIQSQMDSLGPDLTMVARLKELYEKAPDSENADEAAKSLGTTVEDWLAQ